MRLDSDIHGASVLAVKKVVSLSYKDKQTPFIGVFGILVSFYKLCLI